MRLSWMIGGAQGSGVDSSANAFAYAVASAGYNVFGKREYFSNIKGRHSYFTVVASEGPVRSVTDEVHVLTSFDAETVFRHAFEVMKGGALIYDKYLEGERLKNQSMLEPEEMERIEKNLEEMGVSDTLKDVVKAANESGVKVFPVPYMDLLKRVGDLIGEQQLSALTRMVNTLAVAVSFRLLRGELENLEKGLSYAFRAKRAIVRNNMVAAQVAYEYFDEHFQGESIGLTLKPIPNGTRRILVNGTTIVGLGKIVAGCRVQSYYPITPAADESFYLEDKMEFGIAADGELEYPELAETKVLTERGNIVVVQTEDELAAIDLAIGAALAGVRAATATSGPGFSLMPEGLDWASINEVPVVITIYNRGGPSTGMPTRHEQSDLLFSVFAGHGEAPRIVLASGDMEEAFYDTIKAFNYAERYQMPVIHLLDKSIANSTQSIPVPDPARAVIDRGLYVDSDMTGKQYKRFEITESGVSLRVPIGTRGVTFWNTGDEHDELGHISEDPYNRTAMMEKRMRKLELAAREIPPEEKVSVYGDQSFDVWIVSWGSTKGPILDALDLLREEGFDGKLAFLQVRLLWPFPADLVRELLGGAKKIIDIEQNYMGQLGMLMKMAAGIEPTNRILKFNGRPFTMTELRDAIKTVLKTDVKRLVTNRGS
ncbi:MAG: 2-oxoacid:acceptor oxidoreductase subunit alpha [Aigarchaeota archaeon]|nr:2-oxoacid:acceptor oxidoreductase subunit alpha [Candidatus Calditenuis fumarioli]